LINTRGSVTISDAFSRRSLFIGEPGNRESGRSCPNGITFFGCGDGTCSLKSVEVGGLLPLIRGGPRNQAGFEPADKPKVDSAADCGWVWRRQQKFKPRKTRYTTKGRGFAMAAISSASGRCRNAAGPPP
jgi:hypothetical protein